MEDLLEMGFSKEELGKHAGPSMIPEEGFVEEQAISRNEILWADRIDQLKSLEPFQDNKTQNQPNKPDLENKKKLKFGSLGLISIWNKRIVNRVDATLATTLASHGGILGVIFAFILLFLGVWLLDKEFALLHVSESI
ncbi:hypothetical protein V6N13_134084 [Hibiscus sabdariffa]